MKYVIGVVVIALLVFGWSAYSKDKKCEDMALTASVEEVTPAMYPNANDREFHQKQYQRTYKANCMNL